jgi:protein-tyrosine phosphatase
MIDLHCHVLPGIDDGPETLDGSLALARAAAAAGTRTLLATPHVSHEYRNTARRIAGLVAEVNTAIAANELPLEVLTGAEVAASRIADLDPDELSALTLGGGTWLLVECPLGQRATGFDAIVLYLKERGYGVVLAHPERCPAFQRDPRMLRSLVQAGMLTSVTASSLVGRFGREVQRFAREIAAEGLLHNVASDAHDTARRPPGIGTELEQAGLGSLAAWLTEAVPAAILAGEEIPTRPDAHPLAARGTQRSWWRRGR